MCNLYFLCTIASRLNDLHGDLFYGALLVVRWGGGKLDLDHLVLFFFLVL